MLLLDQDNVAVLREFTSNLKPCPQRAIDIIDKYIIDTYLGERIPEAHKRLSDTAKQYTNRYSKKSVRSSLQGDLSIELTKAQLIQVAAHITSILKNIIISMTIWIDTHFLTL